MSDRAYLSPCSSHLEHESLTIDEGFDLLLFVEIGVFNLFGHMIGARYIVGGVCSTRAEVITGASLAHARRVDVVLKRVRFVIVIVEVGAGKPPFWGAIGSKNH